MFGLMKDGLLEVLERYFTLENYEGGQVRWCPGCGDSAILSAVQRICRDHQLPPEKVVAVSGIGCSSRFPHYMGTYGFHGLHGRALPVACGIKSRRPDLKIWVATGDGDCCSIGAGHWMHAIRYNMDMTVMLFDNNVYALTKKQTSPTSPRGFKSNTSPQGSWLPPVNAVQAVLGFTNVSFVAQTVDWNPIHLHATLEAAYRHRGTSFIRILQRCPTYTADIFAEVQSDPDRILLLTHEDGVAADATLKRLYKNQMAHDPADLAGARALADHPERVPIGLFYRNPDALVYEDHTSEGLGMTVDERIEAVNRAMDKFAI